VAIQVRGGDPTPGYRDEDPSGGFEAGGWEQPYFDEILGRFVINGLKDSDGLLLGRRTGDTAPAVIHCVSLSVISPPPPLESWCRKMPSIM
jgi:hypothetical protein